MFPFEVGMFVRVQMILGLNDSVAQLQINMSCRLRYSFDMWLKHNSNVVIH